MEFTEYIKQFSDATVENLCNVFSADIADINLHNAETKLAELFVSIITEAAGSKRMQSANTFPPIIIDSERAIAPDLSEYQDGVLYLQGIKRGSDEYVNPFKKYLEKAVSYYSTKKTLLYAEKPHPFYELYVCNDIKYHKYHLTGVRDTKPEITISDATVEKLEAESKYIIIEGIGGIGKSMFLTHLFLSSAQKSEFPLPRSPVSFRYFCHLKIIKTLQIMWSILFGSRFVNMIQKSPKKTLLKHYKIRN